MSSENMLDLLATVPGYLQVLRTSQPEYESVVLCVVAGGGCCDSGPVHWPGSGEAAGPAQQPVGAAPEGCTQTTLCTGTHTHLHIHIHISGLQLSTLTPLTVTTYS